MSVKLSKSDRGLWIAAAATGVALLGLGLIVANLRFFEVGGEGKSIIPGIGDVAEVVIYAMLVVWFVLLASLAMTRVSFSRRVKVGGSPRFNWGLFIVLISVSLIILVVSATGGKIIPSPPPDSGSGGGSPGGSSQPEQVVRTAADSAVIIGILLGLGLVAGVAGIVLLRRRPIRESAAIDLHERAAANRIVDQALLALYAGEDARSVVVRTYQQMCRLLRKGEAGDTESLTPREFAELAERRLGWPKEPVDRLTSLFEEAWYSPHAMDEGKKEEAASCLRSITEDMGTRRGAGHNGPEPAAR